MAKYSDLDLVQRLCSAVGHLSYLLRRRRREEAKQSMPVWALGLGLAACDMESIKKKKSPESLFDAVSDLFWISLTMI